MKKIIITIIALCIITSCEIEEDDIIYDTNSMQQSDTNLDQQNKPSVNPKTDGVTVPFKSKFFTEQEGEIQWGECEDESIGEGDVGINTQVGGGEATHLGKFTTVMEFCMNFTQVLLDSDGNPILDSDGNPMPDPNFGKYSGVDGIFVAANGDELYFTVEGQVLMYADGENPLYAAYFDDPFTFTGGTGRFEGVEGGGTTNSFTNFVHTDHNWTGTITLLKGK